MLREAPSPLTGRPVAQLAARLVKRVAVQHVFGAIMMVGLRAGGALNEQPHANRGQQGGEPPPPSRRRRLIAATHPFSPPAARRMAGPFCTRTEFEPSDVISIIRRKQ